MSAGKQPISNGSYDTSWNSRGGSSSGAGNNSNGGEGTSRKIDALLAAAPRLSVQDEDDELPSYDDANSVRSGKLASPSNFQQSDVGVEIQDALEFDYAFQISTSYEELATSVVRNPGVQGTILAIQRLGMGSQKPGPGIITVFKLDGVPLPSNQLEVKAKSNPEMGIRSLKVGMLDVLEDDPDIQFGNIDWNDRIIVHGANPQSTGHLRIMFDRPYSLPPDIIFFLREFSFRTNTPRRIRVTTQGIGQHGFFPKWTTGPTAALDTKYTWVSIPKDHMRFDCGTFEVVSKPGGTAMNFTGTVDFTKWKFPKKQPPKVFIGFAGIELDTSRAFRLSTAVTGLSDKGFSWSVRNWDDATYNYAWSTAISWIAIANPVNA
ncbi:hypothetical protein H072_2384 [Dactylellina haptotyla CBS 200.50]|uniref:H-type lectin domain-containing protein n=1 Tax=Dactylellina haptotyla (strain CBS 200.50) TaxID=1284197 RepID=S8AKZ7_DACHA|nr:hypothetical protein H072_2384 [Dactylellina haptotyla CBS 200.50]